MFDEVLDVVIVAVVALLGLAAGFALGKMRGQASARMAKASEVDALRGSCEAMKDDNARLAAQVAQPRPSPRDFCSNCRSRNPSLLRRSRRNRCGCNVSASGPRPMGCGAGKSRKKR